MLQIFMVFILGSVILGNNAQFNSLRVFGGQPAPDGAVPYIVTIMGKRPICGGSIITNRWVLTAAHCYRGDGVKYSIVAGRNLMNVTKYKYPVKQFIVHEDFDIDLIKNDIAVLESAEDIEFNAKIQPIKLPDSDTMGGVPVILSGWGKTSEGTYPNELQWLNMTTMTNEECIDKIKYEYKKYIYNNVICAFSKYNEGGCSGDSGGPLADNGVLVGIVSGGVPCAKGYPDYFVRVFSHKEWILQNIN